MSHPLEEQMTQLKTPKADTQLDVPVEFLRMQIRTQVTGARSHGVACRDTLQQICDRQTPYADEDGYLTRQECAALKSIIRAIDDLAQNTRLFLPR